MRSIAVAFVVLVGACAAEGGNDDEPTAGGTERATQEPARPRAAPPPAQPRQPAVFDLALSKVDVPRAENGAGQLVAAVNPVAIDVRADAWPGRALDPVLTVGQLELHHYSHPDKHTLRFVIADAAALAPGAEVAVQYGNDTSSRVIVTTSLEVTR